MRLDARACPPLRLTLCPARLQALALVAPEHHEKPEIKKVVYLAQLLETCRMAEFWVRVAWPRLLPFLASLPCLRFFSAASHCPRAGPPIPDVPERQPRRHVREDAEPR